MLLDEEHRIRCELCPVNTFKLGTGDGPCVPCTGVLNIDNGKRTACIDPYINKPLLFDEEQRLIVYVSSGSGCLLALFILILFVLKRHTPVVRSSDKFLSFLHLGSLLLTFLCTGYLYTLSNLEIDICIGRTLIFSVLYTLHVSCLYTKSHKLVKAFASKVKLNANEIKQTMIFQIFTVLILLISTNGCLALSFLQISPELSTYTDDLIMIRFNHCNTLIHQYIQILLLTVFQLTCSVQA